jgi:nicotinamide-nucleotide amidase
MRVAVVTTGDELLRGELVDTNTAWLSAELFKMGLQPATHLTVGDIPMELQDTIKSICMDHDIAIFTGGLGPTQDDHTVAAVAAVTDAEIVFHEESLQRAMALFAERGMTFSDNNRNQAAVPANTSVFVNPAGLAPAFQFDLNGCRAYCLPGVPRELKALWAQAILPDLIAHLPPQPPAAYRILKFFGLPESHLARDVAELLVANPDVNFGFRAHYPEVWLKILAPGDSQEAADQRAAELVESVTGLFGHRLFGEGEETMESVVGGLLQARGLTLSTAESCTGGMVSMRLTAVAGSSSYYRGGGVTYANDLKETLVGVSHEIIEQFGAVSEECARAMAAGARQNFGSDLALAVTGIAGPTGGTADKPVGTVHSALATAEGTFHRMHSFRPNRETVRLVASTTALNLVRRYLIGELAATS